MSLNIYLIFGEITLEQQCKDIKTFMNDNKISIPARDNCCFKIYEFKESPYLLTEWNEKNKIIEL